MTSIRLLIIFGLLAAAATAVAAARLRAAAADADDRRQELAECRRFLADPQRRSAAEDLGLIGNAAPTARGTAGATDFESRIRSASSAAGIADTLTSVEIGEASAAAAGQGETQVFLHFHLLTLEDLTRFVEHVTRADPRCRAHRIELAAPAGDTQARAVAPGTANTAPAERWLVDVTLAYPSRAVAVRQGSD